MSIHLRRKLPAIFSFCDPRVLPDPRMQHSSSSFSSFYLSMHNYPLFCDVRLLWACRCNMFEFIASGYVGEFVLTFKDAGWCSARGIIRPSLSLPPATFSMHRKGQLFCFVIGFSVLYFRWPVIYNSCFYIQCDGGYCFFFIILV